MSSTVDIKIENKEAISNKIELAELETVPNKLIAIFEKYPNNTAIATGTEKYSYNNLREKSTVIANKISSFSLDKRSRIAVVGNSSFDFISSIIGSMLSGNIFMTIDNSLPVERQLWMLEEVKSDIVLLIGDCKISGYDQLNDYQTLNCKNLPDDENRNITNECNITLDDPAYIFFTSGSTGKPKGILGTHKGLSHFVSWQSEEFGINSTDRFSQLTALSFDVFLREIFTPLTNGATICIPENKENIINPRVINWFEEENISVIHTVPSLGKAWLSNGKIHKDFKSIKKIFFAGEPLKSHFLEKWKMQIPSEHEIINLYGPTETTLAKSFYRIDVSNLAEGIQPIGGPLPNTQIHIMDENMSLCRSGEVGEIVIRTPYRTLGYINNDMEFRAKFIANPFTNNNEDLIYLTGDLGRYRKDGILEILGRRDNQVKIRGIRIEPGEIETHINNYDKVSEALVSVYTDEKDEKHLVAYFTIKDKSQSEDYPDVFSLRRFLENKLPINMIPSVFVMLDSFPLNQNGKIDRKQLPEAKTNIPFGNEYIPPKTSLEKDLAKIWGRCLDKKKISITDNFFDLGGNSILAVKVLDEMNETCSINLTLGNFFRYSTISKINEIIHKNIQDTEEAVIPLNKSVDNHQLFCLGGIDLYQNLANEVDGLIYVTGVYQEYEHQLIENIQKGTMDSWESQTITGIAEGYLNEIKTHQQNGPYNLLGVSIAGLIAFEVARMLKEDGEDVSNLFILDSHLPNGHKYSFLGKCKLALKKMKKHFSHDEEYTIDPDNLTEEDIAKKRDEINDIAVDLFDKSKHLYTGNVSLIKANFTEYGIGETYTHDMGWSMHVGNDIDVYEIDGSHLGILEVPYVKRLSEIVKVKIN